MENEKCSDMDLSVIIVSRERNDSVLKCIKSLRLQRDVSFELIVVLGPYKERTQLYETLRNMGDVTVCHVDHVNISSARNVGVALARTENIVFIDDDAYAEPGWLSELLSGLNRGADLVAGVVRASDGIQWQYTGAIVDDFGNSTAFAFPGSKVDHPRFTPIGANFATKKSKLLELGGFNEVYAYFLDETDYAIRLIRAGGQIEMSHKAEVIHEGHKGIYRSGDGNPSSYLGIWRSKTYWAIKNLADDFFYKEILKYLFIEREITRENLDLALKKEWITKEKRDHLMRSLDQGQREGLYWAFQLLERPKTFPLNVFHAGSTFNTKYKKSSIAISCRSFDSMDSGIGVWVKSEAKTLAEFGHIVTVIAEVENRNQESVEFTEDGYWIHRIAPLNSTNNKLPPYVGTRTAAVKNEIAKVKSRRPVNLVQYPIWDVEGIEVESVKKVLSLHTTYALTMLDHPEWFSDGNPNWHLTAMLEAETVAISEADLILANSEAIVNDVTRTTRQEFRHKVMVVPHAISESEEAGQHIQDTFYEPRIILFLGRLERRKGIDTFLQLVSDFRLSSDQGNYVFYVAGSKSNFYEEELMKMKIKENIDFKYLGRISNAEKIELFRKKPFLVMPSRYESFGLVALEAMSHGCVVFAGNVGGLVEVISSGTTGFLIEDNLVGEYKKKITELLRDKCLAEKISRNAIDITKSNYSPQFVYQRISQSYEELI